MSLKITFPGGLAVNAAFKGFTVTTDQAVEHGGRGTAPEPFDPPRFEGVTVAGKTQPETVEA